MSERNDSVSPKKLSELMVLGMQEKKMFLKRITCSLCTDLMSGFYLRPRIRLEVKSLELMNGVNLV